MTIKELIAILSLYPEETTVALPDLLPIINVIYTDGLVLLSDEKE